MAARDVKLAWPNERPPPAGLWRLDPPLPRGVELALVEGDSARGMNALARALGPAATLVYLDPPFFTGRVHELGARAGAPTSRMAFDDRWPDLASYLEALRDQMLGARALLAPHGCLVVHVDPKTSHYARVLGDAVFGREAFASEIVWRYRRWPAKTKNFQRVHDVLLRFVRDPATPPRFTQLYEPLAASTRAIWGDRRQRAVCDERGKRRRSSTEAAPSPGAPLGDVWEIGIVAPSGRERTGYPTQKPEALLDRLLAACTAPGDLVVDPTLGSGTTLVVAAKLGRRAIGVDASVEALRVAGERLAAQGLVPARARVVDDAGAARGVRGRSRR